MTGNESPFQKPTARVLKFRRGQEALRHPDVSPVPDLAKYEHGPDSVDHGDDNYRHRMLVNLAAFAFVIALISAGYWLADTMARMRKDQDCVLTGRRGCSPVAVTPHDLWSMPADKRN